MAEGQAVKNLLKRGVKKGIRLLGPLSSAGRSAGRILTYHSIGQRHYEMNVTPDNFAAQMAWLARHYKVIPLEAAAAGVPGIALTFDDGYRDNLINALPVLEQHGFPATVFVVAGCLGGTLPREKEPESGQLLDATGLRELATRGIAIGGHTLTHPRLSTLPAAEQEEEIAGCKSTLEAILGHAVTAFAYPYGSALDYNADTVRLVQQAGFSLACSNRYGYNRPGADPWTLRRIWIDSTDTLETFADKVSGRLDLMRWQDSALGIRTRRWLNRRLDTA